MAVTDILVHFDSYPDATPATAVATAVAIARALGGKLTGLAVHVDIPLRSNRLADKLAGLSALEREVEAKSLDACRAELAQFEAAALAADVFGGAMLERAVLYDVPDVVAIRARTRDLCIVPLADRHDGQTEVAQAVIFSSGRPVLVFAADATAPKESAFRDVVVAWDGSRSSARALADALPILERAGRVRLLSVVNEKASVGPGATAEAARHLLTHGITAEVEEVDAARRSIGEALDAHLGSADLLVMGAYGHSRLREFILGGATQHVLRRPRVPVLLSH